MENNNLNALRTLYIVKGIISILTGIVVLLFLGVGNSILMQQDIPEDAQLLKVLIRSLTLIIPLIIITMGILNFYAAKFIKERRNHTFIFVIAILNCLSGMLGLALGIFTLIEIQKAEVKQLFLGNTV